MAALHALVLALDETRDRAAVELALRNWASEQLGASEVLVELGDEHGVGGGGVVERATTDGGSVVVVDAPSDEPVTITLMRSLPSGQVSDAARRMLVVAGRLFGAALARVRRLEAAAAPDWAAPCLAGDDDAQALIGTSRRAQHLVAMVPRLAQSDVNVLIEGETGVGKTFVARLIHQSSLRAAAPLRVINCSAIPEALLESQLFGHERGAFTGASGVRVGMLEAAGDGTVLLDEIGELSLASQAKLLHVLEERRFERIGSNRGIELRARVLGATNRDLDDMVAAGQFRRDLLFRISVVRLSVPPLRERREDLLLLARRLLAGSARSSTRRVAGFTEEALEVICRYAWPGNVRELRNAIEHAIALGEDSLIGARDLPPGIAPQSPEPEDPDVVRLPSPLAVIERRAIDASLRATNGNRVRAAELLGVTRQTLYNKLRAHKL